MRPDMTTTLHETEGAEWCRSAWQVTGLVLVIDLIWLVLGGWSVPWQGVLPTVLVVAGGQALLLIGRYRRDLRIRITVQAATLLIAFTAAAGFLSYLVVSTNAPLIDARLAAWDRALGFDWLAWAAWLQTHPSVAAWLRLAYFSGLPQMAFIVMILGFTARPHLLGEFLRLFIAATLITILFSGLIPAAGAWKHYGLTAGYDLASLSHFEPLRSGELRFIPLQALQGLISMPSLHAATGVLLVNAARRHWLLLLPVAVLNGALLVATPVDGSHYLVDVIAGVALALALIGADRRRLRTMSEGRPRPAPTNVEALQG